MVATLAATSSARAASDLGSSVEGFASSKVVNLVAATTVMVMVVEGGSVPEAIPDTSGCGALKVLSGLVQRWP